MSALRDELLTILDGITKNCEERARVLDRMTEILERRHPVVWPAEMSEPWQTVPPPLSPRIDTGD